MTADTFQLLGKYNKLTNREMNGILAGLPAETLRRDLGGFFPTIFHILDHIYLADVTWLNRFRNLKPYSSIRGEVFEWPPHPQERIFDEFASYDGARQDLDGVIEAFCAELCDEDLKMNLPYRRWSGEEMNLPLGGTVLHMFNHQTHHRGQISLYLDILGVKNDFSNLHRRLE